MRKKTLFLAASLFIISNAFASMYTEKNHGYASFDISMPIDATGYTLHGKNLTGGDIQFTDNGNYSAPFLAHETGYFKLPVATSFDDKLFIKTTIHYNVIKLIDPNGIHNFFIKIGIATRTEKVSDLDPYVLKDGTYTWNVPIFAVGTESNDVNDKSENKQFMQVGTGNDPSQHNGMYTQQFYLYTQSKGNHAIAEHPQKTARLNTVLLKSFSSRFVCHADGIWGGGGSDPYRTITGGCEGTTTTFPAGPNLDYEYGTFTLPTVHTPWDATPNDHCFVNGKEHAGCTNATIETDFHYMAQKIRVTINKRVAIFAESGTAYRSITPKNLRYECKSNVYLKNLLPTKDCLKKSYLPGGASYPYFSVGYEFTSENRTHYVAQYIYIPEQENADRLAWRDASATTIYAISVSKKEPVEIMRKNFNDALDSIRKIPTLYDVLGKHFFVKILKKNNL